jgi:hypothetical protein
MRKALIGILMAATAATPLAAQDNGWQGRGHNGEDRAQRIEQRNESRQQHNDAQPTQRAERQQVQQVQQVQQTQRVERVQAEQTQRSEGRGNWGGRRQVQEQQPAQVQVQQQAQVRSERWQGGNGNNGGNWNRDARRESNANGFAADRSTGYTDRSVQDRGRYQQQRNNRSDWQQNRGYDNRRDGNRNWSGQRFNRNNWSRSWRNDNRYDWQRYRYQNRSIFNLGRYYAPYDGYGYNRLSIGIMLGEAFFGRDYWIDADYYHLPPAPPGTEWVRYYNDVVLVDMYSGEVIDVIYDFFEYGDAPSKWKWPGALPAFRAFFLSTPRRRSMKQPFLSGCPRCSPDCSCSSTARWCGGRRRNEHTACRRSRRLVPDADRHLGEGAAAAHAQHDEAAGEGPRHLRRPRFPFAA